jgi:hypothetical protein
MTDIGYGAVIVTKGAHKGRILFYDDDEGKSTAICYAGHPLDWAGYYTIPGRYLREPTIDELIKRKENNGSFTRQGLDSVSGEHHQDPHEYGWDGQLSINLPIRLDM